MNERKSLQVEVIELAGTAYEIGVQQGKLLQPRANEFKQNTLQIHVDAMDTREKLLIFAPQLLEELQGIADGIGIDRQHAIQLWGGYNFTLPVMGCTSCANGSFYVRNYDFNDDIYDARLIFNKPNNGYASIGCSQQIIGRLDGMNEKGLVIGLHFVNEQGAKKGFIATTICRMILDQCATTKEAVARIKQIPHQCCFNFSIMDRYGNHAIVEASPQEQIVRYTTSLTCTNHFESEQLKKNNRASIDMSLRRKNYAQIIEKKYRSPLEAFHLFNHEESPLFFTYYKEFFGTLHTIVYCPKSLEIIIGIGGNAEPHLFSFRNWLAGQLHLPSTITGTILK